MNHFLKAVAVVSTGLLFSTIAFAQSDLDKLVEQSGIETGTVATGDHPGWSTPGKIVVRDRQGVAAELQRLYPGADIVAIESRAEARSHMADAVALIGYCAPDLVAAAPKLVWTQIYSAGAERCFAAERIANGEVLLTNMQKMDAPVIAEHVISMVMALARGLVPFTKKMESGEWLDGSTIVRGMDSIAGKTLLVAAFLAELKTGAYFINVGRGGSVVTDDLYAALEAGRLGGVGLDVTDPEPLPPAHPLWQHPDAIITPHVASYGANWSRKQTLLRENVRRYLAGEALFNVVDPELGY